MDLGAYINIDDLDGLAKVNGIEIPRLRGYRLMESENHVSQKEIEQTKSEMAIQIVENLCEAEPFWSTNPLAFRLNEYTDYLKNYYLIHDNNKYTDIRWDRIHGWKRKILKFEIKKQNRRVQNKYDLWNKYAGKPGILYIHSRMGGDNWKYYTDKSKLLNQPWFLDRVDDCFDSTYCDFYARVCEIE